MSKLYYIFVLIAVLAIATLTYQLSTSIEQTTQQADPAQRHDPDYYIRDFNATLYDKQGLPRYRMQAHYLEHFPDDDTLHIQQLHISYQDELNHDWQARSEKGIGYKNIDVLTLSGNVQIQREQSQTGRPLELQTDRLKIDFNKRIANTEAKVKIIGENSTIVATGMELDLKNGTLILKSQARGQYVPN